MDTATPAKSVDDKIAEIKAHMPDVYASIQRKAREIGGDAFTLVRRGLRGERGCFYAMEAGRVVEATELLGAPWFVSGEVIHGEKRGRELGFPTGSRKKIIRKSITTRCQFYKKNKIILGKSIRWRVCP